LIGLFLTTKPSSAMFRKWFSLPPYYNGKIFAHSGLKKRQKVQNLERKFLLDFLDFLKDLKK
jgi:hypothetical protein